MFGDAPGALRYSPSGLAMEAFDYVNPSWRQIKKGKGRGKSNKRRFSDEQIRSLETIFESETRLDPSKKLQVARELGLQPRQVAIWFQNKRARWKSKQLEHDYAILRVDYTQLASRLESLKKEKHALISQLEKLKDLADKGAAAASAVTDGNRSGEEDETKTEPAGAAAAAAAPALSLSDGVSSIKAEWYLGILEEEDDHHRRHQDDSESLKMNMDVMGKGSSLSSTRHGPSPSLNSDDLLNDSSPTQWWDFWS